MNTVSIHSSGPRDETGRRGASSQSTGGLRSRGNCAGEANFSMPTMFSGYRRAQNAGKGRECNLFPLQNAGIITDQFKTPIISRVRIAKDGITIRLAIISPAPERSPRSLALSTHETSEVTFFHA